MDIGSGDGNGQDPNSGQSGNVQPSAPMAGNQDPGQVDLSAPSQPVAPQPGFVAPQQGGGSFNVQATPAAGFGVYVQPGPLPTQYGQPGPMPNPYGAAVPPQQSGQPAAAPPQASGGGETGFGSLEYGFNALGSYVSADGSYGNTAAGGPPVGPGAIPAMPQIPKVPVISTGKVEPYLGNFIFEVIQLNTVSDTGIYMNMRTKNQNGRVITPKFRSDLVASLKGERPFGKAFLLNFNVVGDKFVLHIWKKQTFANSSMGELNLNISDLIDPHNIDKTVVKTFPLQKRPGSTIALATTFQFNIIEGDCMVNIGPEFTTDGMSCGILLRVRMEMYTLQSWMAGLSVAGLAEEAANEVFKKPGVKHQIQVLGSMKGMSYDFSDTISKKIEEAHGVKAKSYTVNAVLINIPPRNVIDGIRMWNVYRVTEIKPVIGSFSRTITAEGLFMDGLEGTPKFQVEVTDGRVVPSREVIQFNLQMHVNRKGDLEMSRMSFADMMQGQVPQFL